MYFTSQFTIIDHIELFNPIMKFSNHIIELNLLKIVYYLRNEISSLHELTYY